MGLTPLQGRGGSCPWDHGRGPRHSRGHPGRKRRSPALGEPTQMGTRPPAQGGAWGGDPQRRQVQGLAGRWGGPGGGRPRQDGVLRASEAAAGPAGRPPTRLGLTRPTGRGTHRPALRRRARRLHGLHRVPQLPRRLPGQRGVRVAHLPTPQAQDPRRGPRDLPARRGRVWRRPGHAQERYVPPEAGPRPCAHPSPLHSFSGRVQVHLRLTLRGGRCGAAQKGPETFGSARLSSRLSLHALPAPPPRLRPWGRPLLHRPPAPSEAGAGVAQGHSEPTHKTPGSGSWSPPLREPGSPACHPSRGSWWDFRRRASGWTPPQPEGPGALEPPRDRLTVVPGGPSSWSGVGGRGTQADTE